MVGSRETQNNLLRGSARNCRCALVRQVGPQVGGPGKETPFGHSLQTQHHVCLCVSR